MKLEIDDKEREFLIRIVRCNIPVCFQQLQQSLLAKLEDDVNDVVTVDDVIRDKHPSFEK